MTASELSYAYPNKMALFRGMDRGMIEVVLVVLWPCAPLFKFVQIFQYWTRYKLYGTPCIKLTNKHIETNS